MRPFYSCYPYPDPVLTLGPDYAITHNLTPFISMQNHYNLVYREEEREMFPTLKVLTTAILDQFRLLISPS